MSGLWLKQKQRMIDHWVGVNKYVLHLLRFFANIVMTHEFGAFVV